MNTGEFAPPAGYAYCATLTRDQWAWEFLRRNPDYQRDYAAFSAIWRALEAAYGTPPDRDFARWKADPRAYGPLPESAAAGIAPTGVACTVDDERVLLECWLGSKWGFYKFPLAPDVVAPDADRLSWRPPPPAPEPQPDSPFRVDWVFDLSLPLAPQLDAARMRLATRLAGLRRVGETVPLSIANQREHWQCWLAALDRPADAAPDTLAAARACRDHGYRDLLRLD